MLVIEERYYGLVRNLKDAEIDNRYSPMDMVRNFIRVRAVRLEQNWIVAEVMKKDRPLIDATGLDITPNERVL